MYDDGESKRLILYTDIEYKHAIRTLPGWIRLAFIDIRMLALEGYLPRWDILCDQIGVRGAKRQQNLADILTSRLLLNLNDRNEPRLYDIEMPQHLPPAIAKEIFVDLSSTKTNQPHRVE